MKFDFHEQNRNMRSLLICLLLAVGVSATPLTITPKDAGAKGYTINVKGDWVTGPVPNVAYKKEAKYAPDYPESIGGLAEYEKNANALVDNLLMVQKMQGKKEYEEVKLGSLRALLQRGKTDFHIYAGVGTTKIIIGYTDGRDSLDRTPYDGILQEVLSSFKMTP